MSSSAKMYNYWITFRISTNMRDILIKAVLIIGVVTFNHLIRPRVRNYFQKTDSESIPEIAPKISNLSKTGSFDEIFPGQSTTGSLYKAFVKFARSAMEQAHLLDGKMKTFDGAKRLLVKWDYSKIRTSDNPEILARMMADSLGFFKIFFKDDY